MTNCPNCFRLSKSSLRRYVRRCSVCLMDDVDVNTHHTRSNGQARGMLERSFAIYLKTRMCWDLLQHVKERPSIPWLFGESRAICIDDFVIKYRIAKLSVSARVSRCSVGTPEYSLTVRCKTYDVYWPLLHMIAELSVSARVSWCSVGTPEHSLIVRRSSCGVDSLIVMLIR